MFSKKQMLGLLLLPLAISAVAAQQVDNGTYVIRNKFTGKVLDLVNGSAADGRTAGMASAARGLAICTPLAPLASGQRYHVTVTGTLGGQGVNLSWAFTTL